MPKSEGQKLKLLYIKDYLEENTDGEHFASTGELIRFLGKNGISAERKSIYSDIDALNAYGMDIVTEKHGKNSGYALASREFELPELKLLVDAVQSSKFITEKKSKKLISKIEKLASKNEAGSLERQVNVADRAKTENETVYYNVDEIHRAIAENKKIGFYYFDRNGKKQKVYRHNKALYKVSPYNLVWDDENYYLVGFDEAHRMNRHYRVDKMASVCLIDEIRDMSGKPVCMGSYSKKCFSMFGGEETLVVFSCENVFAGAIMDKFGSAVPFRPCPGDEGFEFSASVVPSPTFYSWVATFGGALKIKSPESIKAGYAEFLKNAAKATE